jgi:hypothetical protein
MSIKSNHEFATADIILATFLKSRNIAILKINPIDTYRSEFVFAHVPDELLNEWLHSVPQVDVRSAISNYRHLVRNARLLQQDEVRK